MARIPWVRLAAEFAVIFLGVTLGLLADDWRQARDEREAASEALSAILADLETDAEDLGALSREAHADEVSAMWIRRHLGRADVEADSAAPRILKIFQLQTYEPNLAAYAGLRSSGRLTLIRDDEIRRLLTDYYEQAQPRLVRVVNGYDEFWVPLRKAVSKDWTLVYRPEADSYDFSMVRGLELRGPWQEFPSDPDLVYYLDEVGVLANVISGRAAALVGANAELAEAIEGRLAR